MLKKIIHNKILSKEILILSLLYISLLISFVLGENSTSGTTIDCEINKNHNKKKLFNLFLLFPKFPDN